MRKAEVKQILFFIALTFIFCTCNDPVFYAISQEVKPIEPRIQGVPTNFALFNGRMYVASGNTLHSYGKSGDKPVWIVETRPGGGILQVASTGDYLYALCSTDQNNDGKTVIKKFDGSSWTEIGGIASNYEKIHNIIAAGDVLFALALSPATNSSNIFYSIFYIKNDDPATPYELSVADTDAGEMNGAAYNDDDKLYYLSTRNKGVYRIEDLSGANQQPVRLRNSNDIPVNIEFSGIINLGDSGNTIFLIARNGEAYTIKDSIARVEGVSMGKLATGALAIWTKPPEQEDELSDTGQRLLLSGRQDSLSYSYTFGYTYGYLELEIDENGIKSGSNFAEPGRNPLSTVIMNERFQSTIGKYPVSYIYEAPYEVDSEMTLFASTQKNGVWSCRDRSNNSNKYWNAED